MKYLKYLWLIILLSVPWLSYAQVMKPVGTPQQTVTSVSDVQDQAFSAANFDGDTTHSVSQDDFYDRFHLFDTDDDGSFIDESWWTSYFTTALSPYQLRVSGTCSTGYHMMSVNADGTVNCVADATGGGTSLSSVDDLPGDMIDDSKIDPSLVATLNQNTTGTASNVTGTVAVANGGTGATTASDARTELGLVPGTNIQAYDADLDDLADGSLSGSKVGTGINGTNITSGTVADSVIASTIARDSEVTTAVSTKENSLGNPSTNGYVLSSTAAGVRSWIGPGITASSDVDWTGAHDFTQATQDKHGPLLNPYFKAGSSDTYTYQYTPSTPTANRTIAQGDYNGAIPAVSAIDPTTGRIGADGLLVSASHTDLTGNWRTTGYQASSAPLVDYAGNQTFAQNTHNGMLIGWTSDSDLAATLWPAIKGNKITLWNYTTGTKQILLESGDSIILKTGSSISSTHKATLAAGSYVELISTADTVWRVLKPFDDLTDGGVLTLPSITDDFSSDTSANYIAITGKVLVVSGGTAYSSSTWSNADFYHQTSIGTNQIVQAKISDDASSTMYSGIIARYSLADGSYYRCRKSASANRVICSGLGGLAQITFDIFTETWADGESYLTRLVFNGTSVTLYVDWNDDGDFADVGETESTETCAGTGAYTGICFYTDASPTTITLDNFHAEVVE